MPTPAEPDPIEIAARALRRHDRSRADVDERLARAGIDEEQRKAALERLEHIGYVDDERYAVARATALAQRSRGDDAIRLDLERHGVTREQIEAAIASLEREVERASAIAARLGRTTKTAAQLARKGFAADSIEAAVGGDVAAMAGGDV
jgi:regulatory protein